jgi:threonine dehydrogenase-like Zn-dependent dehydrogenase
MTAVQKVATLMKALLYKAPFVLEWEDMDEPIPGEGELLIRVRAVAICGSDLNGYCGMNSMRVPPLVMGHEFSGEITAYGTVTSKKPGTRVVVNPLINCTVCANCISGYPNLCDNRRCVGTTMQSGSYNGAMAEYVVVPERAAIEIPDNLTFEQAAVLEPLAVSLHAVKKGGNLHGKTVVVIGAGPIGLFAVICAADQAPRELICADLVQARLEMALKCGATRVYSHDFVENVRAITSETGVDVVIDAVALEPTVIQAIGMVRNGGKIVVVGMGAEEMHFPIKKMVAHEIQMLGSYTYTTEMLEALKMLPSDKVDQIITSRIPLEKGASAFARLTAKNPADIKIVLIG